MSSTGQTISGLTLKGELRPEYQQILTPEALAFVAELVEGVRRGPYKTAEVEQPPDRNTMTE